MIIKKFQGKTEEEAVNLAKKELGDAVVIMNVKTIKQKGILQFFKKVIVEVTAALEEENERSIPVRQESIQNPVNILAVGDKEEKKPQFSIFTPDIIAKTEESMLREESSGKAIEEKLENLQSLLEKQLKKVEEEVPEKKEVVIVEEDNERVSFLKLLYNTMLENEVKEVYANEIIEEIDKLKKPDIPIDFLLSTVYQKMILKFGTPVGITPAKKGTKVIFFVGTTGVGKTTTIAKIASRFSVDEKKKIALVTTDTYRIAAAEQLRTYAGILDVPFRVIYSSDEINVAVNDFKDYDYILVDTAGHSHNNEEQRKNMEEYLNSLSEHIEKEVFLVLSATTKYRDLVQIADVYSAMVAYKIIFTKLDETTTLGNLLNLRLYTGASLSYVTCGQNVPDDIENFNPQKIVKLLLGGRN